MEDIAHKKTDKMLADLELKIKKVYEQANKEMASKLNKGLKNYNTQLNKKQQQLESGEITNEEFEEWKRNELLIMARNDFLYKTLQEDFVNADKIAAALINGSTPEVYSLNYNYATYQIETDLEMSTSFVLYDHRTVENLIKNDPDLLPHPVIDIPKDMQWNKKHIVNAITQGILQGESVPKIAKRLSNVVGMDERAAIRNARTATTGAQNAGREDSYKRAKKMGIKLKQKWLATLDNRTRHSHRQLDGTIVDVGYKFPNKCRYPGDPQGPPYEVYNCRCTLVPVIKDFERDDSWKQNIIDYAEWKKGGKGFARWLENQKAPDSEIMKAWSDKKMSNIVDYIKSYNKTDANKFYKELKELGKPSEIWEKYLTGQLNAEDVDNLEGILRKYLPKQKENVINKTKENVVNKTKEKIKSFKELSEEGKRDYEILKIDMNDYKVKHYPVHDLEESLSDEQIIKKLAGGDKTKGSCASLSIAYCANKHGLDVIDFRGGSSQDVFSSECKKIFSISNSDIIIHKVKRETVEVAEILQQITPNKQYCMVVGRHMAIIKRLEDGEIQYLEMQSGVDENNGWVRMGKDKKEIISTLVQRFRCRKSVIKNKLSGGFIPYNLFLADVDSFEPNDYVREIMGYINTPKDKQQKGKKGSIK